MKSKRTDTRAFTLVEVALAIAVIAIGLIGILALFPLGLRATRSATDNTAMAMIAQDYIACYQQIALNSNNYSNAGTPVGLLEEVSYSNTRTNAGVIFTVHVDVKNHESGIVVNGTNLQSRITISVFRPGSATNIYITEASRYAMP